MFTSCSYCGEMAFCGTIVLGNYSRRCCAVCWEWASESIPPTAPKKGAYCCPIIKGEEEGDNPWHDLANKHFEDRFDGLESMVEENSNDS